MRGYPPQTRGRGGTGSEHEKSPRKNPDVWCKHGSSTTGRVEKTNENKPPLAIVGHLWWVPTNPQHGHPEQLHGQDCSHRWPRGLRRQRKPSYHQPKIISGDGPGQNSTVEGTYGPRNKGMIHSTVDSRGGTRIWKPTTSVISS